MNFRGLRLVFIIAFLNLPQLITSQNVVSGPQNPQVDPQIPGTQFNGPQNQQFGFQNPGQQFNVPQMSSNFNPHQQVQFQQQQQSPWAGFTNILSQIPMGTLMQMIISFVQNTPIMYVLNSIFGKSFVIFQILSVSYSVFAAISLLFPSAGQYLQQQVGSITNAIVPTMYNLPNTIRSAQPFSGAMDMVGINLPDCQLRASCEAGQLVFHNFPNMAQILNLLGNVLPIEDKYNQPFLRGTSNVNCAAAFRTCPQSPFQTLFNFTSNFDPNQVPRRK